MISPAMRASRYLGLAVVLLLGTRTAMAYGPLEDAIAAAEQAKTQADQAQQLVAQQASAVEKAAQLVKSAEALVAAAEAVIKVADGEARQAAQKALESGRSALQAAQAASKAAQQARSEAEKKLSAAHEAARNAELTAQAEQAWAAHQKLEQATKAVADARRELDRRRDAVQKALSRAADAQRQLERAERERATAEKALAEKTAAAKSAAEAALAERDGAKQQELQKVSAQIERERAAAEAGLASKSQAAKQAAEQFRRAQAAAERLKEEERSAEKAVRDAEHALVKAHDDAATSEAAALQGLEPITSDEWTYEKARHLLMRAGFGGTPQQIADLYAMGPQRAVEHFVYFDRLPPAHIELDVWPENFRLLSWQNRLHRDAQEQLRVYGRLGRNEHRRQLAPLRQWWLRRMVESPRPLQEKLTLFWHDHFAVQYMVLYDVYALYRQNQLFREHALRFDALLHGIVQDPAMLRYLDNHVNRAGNTNENLGREILELFSMGEENSAAHRPDGYTEDDVRDAATRALTGATIDRETGQFRFRISWHDAGDKQLLGRRGKFGPHEAVDVILQHPATSEYIVKKLYEYFVHHQANPETVRTMARVLRENQYRLEPVLKNLFLSKEFYSDKVMGEHIKGPVELIVSTVKITGVASPDYAYMDRACQGMGQTLFEPPDVAGWREGKDWITAEFLLERYNRVAELVERRNPVDLVAALEGQQFDDGGEVVDYLIQQCLTVELSAPKRQELIEFAKGLPPRAEWGKQRNQVNAKLRAILVMLISLPEYQVS